MKRLREQIVVGFALPRLDATLERQRVPDIRTELEGIVRELYERTERLVMMRDERDQAFFADYIPERDWDYPRRRRRAQHHFPTLSVSERLVLLSAVTALLRGPSAADIRAVDPLRRLWQVLTPHHRHALAVAGRRWPQRIRVRLFDAMAGRHSTI